METDHAGGGDRREAAPGRPGRRALPVGLALVLAASAAWSAVALLNRHAPPASARAAAKSAAAAPMPAVIPTQGPAAALGDLQMETPTSGWARRLRDGVVLHTASGILRWVVASPPGPILAFAAVDAQTARALTAAPGSTAIQSWATSDGGATWLRRGGFTVDPLSPSTASLDFVDADHGWFSDPSGATAALSVPLFRTDDGGADWTPLSAHLGGSPGTPRQGGAARTCGLLTVSFRAPSVGFITGSCDSGPPPLYVSHDGGATWVPVPLTGLRGAGSGNTSFPPVFTSPDDGSLLTESEAGDPASASIFSTADGGATWVWRSTLNGTPLADAFQGGARGWLVLDSPYGDAAAPELYRSVDGAGTWSRLGAFPYLGLRLDFVTAEMGWAAPPDAPLDGGAPYLLETDDGGLTWTALRPAISPAPPA